MAHFPALLQESVSGLRLRRNSSVVDATADGGGHASKLLKELGKRGKLILLDWDPAMISILRKKFGGERRVKIFHLNFRDLRKLRESQIRPDAIFFDLGLSSLQLKASGRGFSFQRNEPLIMRFNPEERPSAAQFLKSVPRGELEKIIRDYGEERFAGRIAKAVTEARIKKEIQTSAELARIIAEAAPGRGRIHPATRTFQALRIHLNDELSNLKAGLEAGWEILKPGGRIAAISFHSLEDRIVKNFFREKAGTGLAKLITPKPMRPGAKEIKKNPSSRSAKLRILEKHGKKNHQSA